MHLHCARAEVELAGDLTVRHALLHQCRDLRLATGEAVEVTRLAWRPSVETPLLAQCAGLEQAGAAGVKQRAGRASWRRACSPHLLVSSVAAASR